VARGGKAAGRAAAKAGAGVIADLAKPLLKEAENVGAKAAKAAKAVARDSRGRAIPPGVKRLPSGKLPANYKYAGRVYDGEKWTRELAEKYPNGVRFTADGYPDFGPYATHRVTIDPHFAGNHTTDFTAANRAAGLRETGLDHTWHHHQDGRTLLRVPTDLHDAVRHAGGVALSKGR